MLMNAKTEKYFRYAIGEVVLVVIGILIALQINNWNENRKARIKENILLNQLHQEFLNDLQQLKYKTEQRNLIIYSAKKVLDYIDNDYPDDPDSISFFLQRSLFIPTFNTSSKDFFSARDISLLKNDSLRGLLANWPSQVEQLVEGEKQWVDYRDNQYLKFLTENYQTRNLYNGIQKDLGMMRTVFLDKSKSIENIIKRSKNIDDPNLILMHKDLEDHLGFAIMIHSICNVQTEMLSQHIEKILTQIQVR